MTGHANFRPFDESELGEAYLHPSIARALQARALRLERDRRIDLVLQVSIAVLTLAAIGLLAVPSEYSRWGYVIGLASQPFYIAAAGRTRQWGMFVVAWVLLVPWTIGIANHFF